MPINFSHNISLARERLPGSYISLSDLTPIYVADVDSGGGVEYRVSGGNEFKVGNLEEMNFSPIQLGYVNSAGSVGYICRMPSRHWRHGVRNNTVYIRNNTGARVSLDDPGLVNTSRGVFPSLDEAMDLVENGEARYTAFSRHYAIGHYRQGLSLFRKTTLVGKVSLVGQSPTLELSDRYGFLSDELKEYF